MWISSRADGQGVPFIVTEIPNADPFMLHIYAAVAEQERTKISERTKAALAPPRRAASSSAIHTVRNRSHPRRESRCRGAAPTGRRPRAAAQRCPGRVCGQSANATAKALNARGLPSPRGGKWTARSVINVRSRLAQPVRKRPSRLSPAALWSQT